MNTIQQDVHAFHKAFGHPAPAFPLEAMTDEVAEHMLKRVEWLREEAQELEDAVNERDMIGALDALGDGIYFGVGGYVVLGHNMQDYWANIQDANMAKLGPDGKPIVRESDGKVMKPEGWVAPEERHQVTLDNAIAAAKLESAARQLAHLTVTQPDEAVDLVGASWTPAEYTHVILRTQQILSVEGDAERLYAELEEYVEAIS